jgi:protein-disulfide isomerase
MSKLKPAVNAGDHHIGNTNAVVILVEFGDFECPHCGRAHPLVQRLLKEMGANIYFVFRHFPLQESHPHAYMAATAAEAAGKQDKFWEMHDLIFEHQQQLSPETLARLAEKLHLDLEKFADDWKSESVEGKVEKDFESGVRSGVNGTPTFFLNGQPVYMFDGTYESLAEAVQIEMNN